MRYFRGLLLVLVLGIAPQARADEPVVDEAPDVGDVLVAEPEIDETPAVRDAIATVAAIDRARRAGSERRMRALVGSDALVVQLMPWNPPVAHWPDGPLRAARGSEHEVVLRYGLHCLEGRGCIHEIELVFARRDGKMILVDHHQIGW